LVISFSKDNAIHGGISTLKVKTLELKRFKLIQQSDLIGEAIWKEVIKWKYFERDTIGKQLTRAADSISANLSEAYGRYTYSDRKRFAYYARGSLCETLNWLSKSIQRSLIDSNTGNELLLEIQSLSI
jgi:four helix bundle protein